VHMIRLYTYFQKLYLISCLDPKAYFQKLQINFLGSYCMAIFSWAYYMVHQNTYIVPLSDDLAHPYSMHEVSAAASCGILNHIGFA